MRNEVNARPYGGAGLIAQANLVVNPSGSPNREKLSPGRGAPVWGRPVDQSTPGGSQKHGEEKTQTPSTPVVYPRWEFEKSVTRLAKLHQNIC